MGRLETCWRCDIDEYPGKTIFYAIDFSHYVFLIIYNAISPIAIKYCRDKSDRSDAISHIKRAFVRYRLQSVLKFKKFVLRDGEESDINSQVENV